MPRKRANFSLPHFSTVTKMTEFDLKLKCTSEVEFCNEKGEFLTASFSHRFTQTMGFVENKQIYSGCGSYKVELWKSRSPRLFLKYKSRGGG